MSLTGNNILGGASGQTTGYDIPYSIKTAGTGERISRTMNSTGAATPHFTYSTWYKKTQPVILTHLLWWQCKAIHSNAVVALSMPVDPEFRFNLWTGSASEADRYSAEKYRDPAAWMHIVMQWNGATFAIYVNNVLVNMDTSGNINGNSWGLQTGNIMRVSSADHGDGDGYTAETYFIEGQTLAPSNFGAENEDTGQWLPIEYEGTYSGNSFYLDYADSSDLGKDVSGLDNHFTVSGGIDANSQVLDSPTNNYCTLNPLLGSTIDRFTLSEGNLKAVPTGSDWNPAKGTFGLPNSGKWYWECVPTSANIYLGISSEVEDLTVTNPSGGVVYYGDDGGKRIDGTDSTYGAGYGSANIIGIAVDMDASPRTIQFYKDNAAQGSIPITGNCATGIIFPLVMSLQTNYSNFGQDSSFSGQKTAQGNGGDGEDFYYTPPTGYKALNTDNLPDPAIALPTDNFNAVIYTGNDASPRSITGVGFEPGFVWIKDRDASYNHVWNDIVRGVGVSGTPKTIYSDSTGAEGAQNTGHVSAFNSDGFSIADGSAGNARDSTNNSGEKYVSWNWKAGGTASTNTDGAVDTQVSANTTAGFSIATYTSDGSTTAGHGLSQAPELIIIKRRDTAADWIVGSDYIKLDGPSDEKWHYGLKLNSDVARAAETAWFGYHTAPTSTTFPLGNSVQTNTSGGTYVAYCFHGIDGYSKVGSYTGNNDADGVFVYTGFKPSFVLIKEATVARSWVMFDNKRNPYNEVTTDLKPDSTSSEGTSRNLDFLSNGIKMRESSAFINDALTYIYIAFAESPFKTSNAR